MAGLDMMLKFMKAAQKRQRKRIRTSKIAEDRAAGRYESSYATVKYTSSSEADSDDSESRKYGGRRGRRSRGAVYNSRYPVQGYSAYDYRRNRNRKSSSEEDEQDAF